MRVCSFGYPAYKVHAPYYTVVCGLSGSTTFSFIISQWHDFREKVIQHTVYVLTFSTTFVWNTSHSKKNSVTYNVHSSSRKITVIFGF